MSAMQFLAGLPALLGFTGFLVFIFLRRNRAGDRVTLDIVARLRAQAPGRLPADAEKLDAATLSRLIASDEALRSKVDEQDFQLLRDALRQQYITSIIVYVICGTLFVIGSLLFVYSSTRPKPVTINNLRIESALASTRGLLVDLDPLVVRWTSSGDPEDVQVSLEDMGSQRRTPTKTAHSGLGELKFTPQEVRSIIFHRGHGEENRIRVVIQTRKESFISPEFTVVVGVTILAVRIAAENRVKIMGTIDNQAIPFYNFEAKLLIWGRRGERPAEPLTLGGKIQYGSNDFHLDKAVAYDFGTAKIFYLGPDDPRRVRTELLGF